jgi:PAS domain S-box-containing protein
MRLETVFEQMPAGVVIVDAASERVVLSNTRGARIIRHAMADGDYRVVMGPWRRRRLDGSDLAVEEWPITRALRGETVRDEVYLFSHSDEDGVLSVSASPVRDGSGTIVAAISTFVDVTEQEAAREALRLSEDRYRTLAESLPLAIFSSSPEGEPEYVNQSWLAYTGNAPETALSEGWKRSLVPEDRPAVDAAWAQAIATGEPLEVEYRLLRWDGMPRWHLERARPHRDASGRVRGWIGHATDIHDQKLAAEREQLLAEIGRQLAMSLDLRETLERVAACAVPNLGDICLVDVAGEGGTAQRVAVAHVNPEATKTVAAAMEVGPRAQHDNPVARVLRTGRPEVVFQLASLSTTVGDDAVALEYAALANVSGFMVLPLRAHGQVLGTITFLNTDASRPLGPDHVTLAQEVADRAALAMANARLFAQKQQTAAELAASEERYRMLVEATPTNVSLVDTEGRTLFRNRTLQQYTGEPEADSYPGQWLERIHPDDRVALTEAHRDAVVAGEQLSAEFRLRSAAGDYRWHLAEAVPIRDASGTISSWLTVSADIDEVKQAQEALQRANALKDEFLGLVSHELRTPLTGILGNAQVLRRHWERMEPTAREGALEDIRDEAQRLQRLVENMLVLAGIEGRGEISTEPLLVQRVVPHVVAAHHARHPWREIRMEFEPNLAPVEASPTYFDQVLANLLSNAEKYSPGGTPIDVSARLHDGEVEIRVLDRGPGISDEEVEHVFRPFYRSEKTAATAAGAGLGLAVCKRLVDAQGGRIWAARREGGGTEFGFALPVDR